MFVVHGFELAAEGTVFLGTSIGDLDWIQVIGFGDLKTRLNLKPEMSIRFPHMSCLSCRDGTKLGRPSTMPKNIPVMFTIFGKT
jgi:hypothetical protein